jgi:hypothetical protein
MILWVFVSFLADFFLKKEMIFITMQTSMYLCMVLVRYTLHSQTVESIPVGSDDGIYIKFDY